MCNFFLCCLIYLFWILSLLFYSFKIFCFESTCSLSNFSFKSARLFFFCLLVLRVFDYSLAHEWDNRILTTKDVYHICLLIQNHHRLPIKEIYQKLKNILQFLVDLFSLIAHFSFDCRSWRKQCHCFRHERQ